MKSRFTVELAGATCRALGVAAALACGADAAMAAGATLKITSFDVTAEAFSGNFAWVTDPYQSFGMSAQQGGGLYGSASDNFTAENWNLGLNRLAQTPNALATGNLVQFTDALTQLMTAGFNLSADATPGAYIAGSLPNYANASALQSGTFVLLDGDGALTSGTVTFDIYYDMSVATPNGLAPISYSQTALSVLSSSGGGGSASFNDGMVSTALAGGSGTTSGHFTWTYTLTAGQAAYYTLSGSAISQAVAAVPEPSSYALMAFGLAAIGVTLRRRRID